MKRQALVLASAALLGGAAALLPVPAKAGSCCGGGGSFSPIVPRALRAMADVSFEMEKYDGFWNQDGEHVDDPAGSDLRQYRVNAGYAQRFAADWQAGLLVPYVWNVNDYATSSTESDGLGDSVVALWYEATDERSIWKIRSWSDLVPSVTVGLSLLVPTGVSPYDDADTSYDVTGRGLYRLDGNLVVEKTYIPWGLFLSFSYGTYFERSVNQEYGKYVEPYDRDLGNRLLTTAALSYSYYMGTGGDTLTGTLTASYLHEDNGTVDGNQDPTTGFHKTAMGALLTYASTDHDWSVRAGWSHAIQSDGWGENFPTTDVYALGVRHGFR